MATKLNGQWVDLFRAGNYGDRGNFTADDLNHIANSYDPAFSMAPLVKGHPKTDDEAHGWVTGMRVVTDKVGAKLQGLFQDVKAETEKLMEAGAFRNRSVAIYDDLKGKGLYLRHVGLLGAVPPEVKALGPVTFDDGEAKFSAHDFKDDEPITAKPAGDGDDDKKGDGVTKTEVKTLLSNFAANLTEGLNKIFSKKPPTNGSRRTVGAGGGSEMAETQKAIDAAIAKERALNAAHTFVATQKAAKKWIPAFTKAGFEEMLEALAILPLTITFGEEGKTQEATAYEMVTALFKSLPELIPTNALGTVGKKVVAGAARFAEPDKRGVQIDPDSLTLAEEMEKQFAEIKKAHPEMPDQTARRQALTAARQVSLEGSGSQSIGQA
jgi:hypothetical protein